MFYNRHIRKAKHTEALVQNGNYAHGMDLFKEIEMLSRQMHTSNSIQSLQRLAKNAGSAALKDNQLQNSIDW